MLSIKIDYFFIQTMNSIIIDNCIILRFMDNGISIKKISKKDSEMNNLERITTGSRIGDVYLIQQLSDGILKYEDLLQMNH